MLFASGILLIVCALMLLWVGIAATIGAFRWQHRPLIAYGAGLIAFGVALLNLARALFQPANPFVLTMALCALATTCFFVFQRQGGWGDLTARGLTRQRFFFFRRLPEPHTFPNSHGNNKEL